MDIPSQPTHLAGGDDGSHPLEGFVSLMVAPFLDYHGIQALRRTSKVRFWSCFLLSEGIG